MSDSSSPTRALGRTFRRPRPEEWTFPEWLLLLAASYFVTILGIGLVTGLGPEYAESVTPPRVVLASAFLLPACFLTSAWWLLRYRSRRPPEDVLHLGRPVVNDIVVGALTGLGLQIAMALVFSAFDVKIEQQIGEDIQRIVGWQLGLLVVLVALVAPLAEEVFFRVLLFDALRRRLPVVWAVVLQGAIFGLVHIQPWAALPALAVAGVVFGTLFARGRSIWACVAAHMAFNALAVVDLLR